MERTCLVMVDVDVLPKIITLVEHGGDYHSYINAIFEVFDKDFNKHKTKFGSHTLNYKYHVAFQNRAYTFYHMTHKGNVETERIPDLRRCERMPWARPTIERAEEFNLKFWESERKGKSRVCIWLDVSNGDDYFVILEVRKECVLLWTAFYADYSHEVRKKQKEYNNWLTSVGGVQKSPDELIKNIRDRFK